jgi:hypothetical protein
MKVGEKEVKERKKGKKGMIVQNISYNHGIKD